MMAITSLIYSRAQAWCSSSTQRGSLYAAEKCFAGIILFGLSWAEIFGIGVVLGEFIVFSEADN